MPSITTANGSESVASASARVHLLLLVLLRLHNTAQHSKTMHKQEHTFAHDLFLGVGLLTQDTELIIAVYEHDAGVVPVLHSPLILLHSKWIVFNLLECWPSHTRCRAHRYGL